MWPSFSLTDKSKGVNRWMEMKTTRKERKEMSSSWSDKNKTPTHGQCPEHSLFTSSYSYSLSLFSAIKLAKFCEKVDKLRTAAVVWVMKSEFCLPSFHPMAYVSSNDSAAENFSGKSKKTTGEINGEMRVWKWKEFIFHEFKLRALFEHKKLVCVECFGIGEVS